MSPPELARASRTGLRWWPAVVIVALVTSAILWVRDQPDRSFQERNLATLAVLVAGVALLTCLWLVFSRAPWKLRLSVAALTVVVVGCAGALFRIRGVSGDLVPILDWRWGRTVPVSPAKPAVQVVQTAMAARPDFPQFLGPHRTAELEGPELDWNWSNHRPQVLWRQPIGEAWSGWAIVGTRAFTQEQQREQECSTCYEVLTGHLLWSHAEHVHYQNALAGEGPRCTPTVVSNRVLTLGATGILNCLELESGRQVWARNIVEDAQSQVPEWGFAGSPLVYDGKVVVSAGGHAGRSLLAYEIETGQLLWSAGTQSASYGSPMLTLLADVRQVLAFNSHYITAHDARSGEVLWEYPWGNGQPQVAAPVVVGTNRVLFSSGYGVGSELLEVNRGASGNLVAGRLWRSRQMKAKFANLVQREGFLYGLDDGVLACLDLEDGSRRWKDGRRYGHGQGLLVNDLFLLMAENGELVLLRPTFDAPNELHRFRVFSGKTWNPIALAGDLLLARTEQEAACLRLALRQKTSAVRNPEPRAKPGPFSSTTDKP